MYQQMDAVKYLIYMHVYLYHGKGGDCVWNCFQWECIVIFDKHTFSIITGLDKLHFWKKLFKCASQRKPYKIHIIVQKQVLMICKFLLEYETMTNKHQYDVLNFG